MSQNKHLEELFELLSIPTISAQTKHSSDIKKACNWLSNKLNSLGFKAEIIPSRHPIHGNPFKEKVDFVRITINQPNGL